MKIRQLFDHQGTSTLTYIIRDCTTMEGAIIDSVHEHFERDTRVINEIGVKLKYIIDTHIHADHVTGSTPLANEFGAKIVLSSGAKDVGAECADLYVKDGDRLSFGEQDVGVLETPGHTSTCMTLVAGSCSDAHKTIFSGDVLMHRGTGRTDFQDGAAKDSYDSVTRLYKFPDDTVVYSAHDYSGVLSTTIGECKKFNESINENTTMDEFIAVQKKENKNRKPPARMDTAVPGCLKCGKV